MIFEIAPAQFCMLARELGRFSSLRHSYSQIRVMSHYGINESLGWVYVCPCITISFVSFKFMSQNTV